MLLSNLSVYKFHIFVISRVHDPPALPDHSLPPFPHYFVKLNSFTIFSMFLIFHKTIMEVYSCNFSCIFWPGFSEKNRKHIFILALSASGRSELHAQPMVVKTHTLHGLWDGHLCDSTFWACLSIAMHQNQIFQKCGLPPWGCWAERTWRWGGGAWGIKQEAGQQVRAQLKRL